ncbi:MAG TPA: hypothetical protein P5141_02220 [Candidatus Hydrogenedentes bacterium]|nr:hypothetical protein [Candidatus Hydrogenedentota bacterium]HOC71387.1 hypothetical protein [Candidatus Hydrogenedentota bacterium]HOH49767.1 hypothetical protein [Candidatus Hydrogenedentota bacterium]HPA41952.1 hypothetical protein [Candidatus Hydrogenedentota bacterium]HQL95260.1 hypothetical protein [Candidatus Hydrogenedentota bacterium]
MPIKYYCPKCHRRFLEWGAEKLSHTCPNPECGSESLVLMESTTLEAPEKPKLKKVKRKKTPPVIPLGDDFDVDEAMVDMPLEDEDFEDVEVEEEELETEEVEETEEVLEETADDFEEEAEATDDLEADDTEEEIADDDLGGDLPLDTEEL